MTKDEVLSLPDTAANEEIVVRLLGWTRLGGINLGTANISDAWLLPDGSANITDAYGNDVPAPKYKVVLRSAIPDFGTDAQSVIVVGAMMAHGYEMRLKDNGDGTWRCAFLHDGEDATPYTITMEHGSHAIRGAALLRISQ